MKVNSLKSLPAMTVLLRHSFTDQGCRFAEQNGRLHFQATFFDQLFGFFGIGSLQAYNDGHLDGTDRFVCIDYTLRHTVATHYTAEYIDKDRFYFRVF